MLQGFQEYGNGPRSTGPWGGLDGFHWNDGVNSSVKRLEIAHGAGIDSIRVEYQRQGYSVWAEKHGGNGGPKTEKVELDYPNEFLTSIHGYYGPLNQWGPIVVRSLTFVSNKRTFGPYGIEQGTYFSLPYTGVKIVGFHGRCGWYLDAIGVYFEPLHKQIPVVNSMVPQYSQNYMVNGSMKHEYSMFQGSFSKNYDLIVAVRCKDDYGDARQTSWNSSQDSSGVSVQHKDDYSVASPGYFSRQTSSSSQDNNSDTESKSQQASGTASSTPDRVSVFSNNTMVKVPSKTIEKVPSTKGSGVLQYGPWGGVGGTVFDDGVYDGIKQIILSRNMGIVYIKVCYLRNGQEVWGSKNGGTGGFKTDKVVFDYPSEILTHITGFYGATMLMGPNIIKSLTFHTTKRTYGPYGDEQGKRFATNIEEGMIVGFHGRKGLFLDAIGVHVVEGKVKPAPLTHPANTNSYFIGREPAPSKELDDSPRSWNFRFGRRDTPERVVQRVVNDPAPYETGPWGGSGGRPWDDGVFSGIRQILLTITAGAISSIELEYDRNGQSVWSVKHGGSNGQSTVQIKLEHPDEVITCISGYYGPINSKEEEGMGVVKSLTFITTRRKLGPYGVELGKFFTSTTTKGKVVGFHGRSSVYLDAIGVHMQHWLGNEKPFKPSALMKIFY